jgi:hypothetical protein
VTTQTTLHPPRVADWLPLLDRTNVWLADHVIDLLAGRFRFNSYRNRWERYVLNIGYWGPVPADVPADVVREAFRAPAGRWAGGAKLCVWITRQTTAGRIASVLRLARLDSRLSQALFQWGAPA